MELIVIDIGLTGKGEHSYRLVKDVRAALLRRDIRHRIFGCRAVDRAIVAELGVVPHFSRSLYESVAPGVHDIALDSLARLFRGKLPDPRSLIERRTRATLDDDFARDLGALPADTWTPDNLILVTAISQNQLLGLIRYMLGKNVADMPPVVCQLMFAPSWTPWGQISSHGEPFYREAFRAARQLMGRTLFFTTENDAMAELYRERFGIATTILPIPFGVPATPRPPRKRPRVGFFGYSKTDKGFHLLPTAIELCRRAGLDVEFVVQIQHSGWEPAAVAADHALRAMSGVRILDGVLSSEDYNSWTTDTDVVLLPYHPVHFGKRGSGIFTECVAAGRPIVASAGTWAAESILRGEAEGEIFAPHDAEALAGAIRRLLPRLETYRAAAAKGAGAFARKHSPDAYIDALSRFSRM